MQDETRQRQHRQRSESILHDLQRRQSETRTARFQSESAERATANHAAREIEVIARRDLDVELLNIMLHRMADQTRQPREREERAKSEHSDVGVLLKEAQDLIGVLGASRDVRAHSPSHARARGGGFVRRIRDGGEIEVGEGIPEVFPALGEHAGARSGLDRQEGEDEVEDVVGEIADAILIVEVWRRRRRRRILVVLLLPLSRSRFHSFVDDFGDCLLRGEVI